MIIKHEYYSIVVEIINVDICQLTRTESNFAKCTVRSRNDAAVEE